MKETYNAMEKENVHVYVYPCCDVFCDFAKDFQELAHVYQKSENDGYIPGAKVVWSPYLKEHLKDYPVLVKHLKNLEKDNEYVLSPRSVCQREDLEKLGVTWSKGRYYKDGNIFKCFSAY